MKGVAYAARGERRPFDIDRSGTRLEECPLGEAPDELPLRLVNLVERLAGHLETTRIGKATRSDLPLRDDL
jgi:hypothetical protein